MKPKRLIVVRFRQNRQRWEVDYFNPPGSTPTRERRLFETEEAALAYAATVRPKLEAEALPVRDQSMTLRAAFERYFQVKGHTRSERKDRHLAAHLKAEFGEQTPLRAITTARVSAYKARRLATGSVRRKDDAGQPAPLSAAAINRPLALLRHLLRLAHEDWGVLRTAPPKVRLEREPEGRLRWLAPNEEARLLAACAKSQNRALLALVTVALESGMRQQEILSLTWARIDTSRGVLRLEQTKSGRRREVPMRQVVYDLLTLMPAPREGRVWPITFPRTAWEHAVADAKIEDFHFHDLRHHFASSFMMRGGTLLALQKILGHASLAMTMRYAHLSPDHLRAEMAKTERPAGSGTRMLEPERPSDAEVVGLSSYSPVAQSVERVTVNH
jgi:integrase